MTRVERLLIGAGSLALSLLLIALLSGFFASRDRAALSAGGAPGQPFHALAGVLPPLPGPAPRLAHLRRELAAGDVVIVYGSRRPPRRLQRLARSLAGRPTAALVAAGQAVVLRRLAGATGLTVLAWRRFIRVGSPRSPALERFVRYWLGRGASAP